MIEITDIQMDGVVIGVDVAKPELVFYADREKDLFTARNKSVDLQRTGKRLLKLKPRVVVFEASGGYEALAVRIFAELGLPVLLCTRSVYVSLCAAWVSWPKQTVSTHA